MVATVSKTATIGANVIGISDTTRRPAKTARTTAAKSRTDFVWSREMKGLLDTARKLRPNSPYVSRLDVCKQWVWIMNGTDKLLELNEPIELPTGPFGYVFPRHIFIVFEGKLVGYLTEERTGWCKSEYGDDFRVPSVYDMVKDFETAKGEWAYYDLVDTGFDSKYFCSNASGLA